jgi:hypothetical protein
MVRGQSVSDFCAFLTVAFCALGAFDKVCAHDAQSEKERNSKNKMRETTCAGTSDLRTTNLQPAATAGLIVDVLPYDTSMDAPLPLLFIGNRLFSRMASPPWIVAKALWQKAMGGFRVACAARLFSDSMRRGNRFRLFL